MHSTNKMNPAPTKYSLVPDPHNVDSEYWCVKLESGEFSGVTVQLQDLSIAESPDADGNLPLQFQHDILHIPEELRQKEFPDEKRQEFVDILGGILVGLIQENLDAGEEIVSEDDEGRMMIKKRVEIER